MGSADLFVSLFRELEKAVEKGEKAHSAMNARKTLYSKVIRLLSPLAISAHELTPFPPQILTLWPQGDMTTNQLSRESESVSTFAPLVV